MNFYYEDDYEGDYEDDCEDEFVFGDFSDDLCLLEVLAAPVSDTLPAGPGCVICLFFHQQSIPVLKPLQSSEFSKYIR
jgi:hypothetical protein